ncbi:MAG: hypothetical protein A2355_08405 [Spirochaetes bacterium RIFOXYB1_FULL_32_8]|nr:MAG: hypothetical protein A2355_08405 [Spirochaetes bacterium RIFOXYB1_FULL_32_8]
MDYQMFKTLGLFFSARFTSYIDWSYWLYIEPYQNIVFIPTVGIKLFADKDFSIVGEAGIEKVFEDDILKFIKLGLSIRYRLK